MKKTQSNVGATINLYINGSALEVETETNRLFNFGIVSNIPADYDAKDSQVHLQTDSVRMAKGFLAMAIVAAQGEKASAYKGRKGGFLNDAKAAAFDLMAEYVTDEGERVNATREPHLYVSSRN